MKTIEDIGKEVAKILDAGTNLVMYFGIGDEKSRVYKRANLLEAATESVKSNYAAGIREFLRREGLKTHQLSRFDQRSPCLWFYDLAEKPDEFAQLESLRATPAPDQVEGNVPLFSFNDQSISDIKTIAVRIASAKNTVLFVKKVYPVSLIKRDQLLLFKSKDRLEVFNEDLIKVAFGFEMLLLDGDIYINEFVKFEKAFGFDTIAERRSKKLAKAVLDLNIVEDVKGYLKEGRISRKDVLRTGNSPVLSMKPVAIVRFAVLKEDKIGLKVVGGKLQLTSLESMKKLFNLLNDDYLTSGLTAVDYESLAKNEITPPNGK